MKKSYIFLALILVVLILTFSFTKTYLHSLEDEAKWKQRSAGLQAQLDSLEQQLQTRFHEGKAFESAPAVVQPTQKDDTAATAVVRETAPQNAAIDTGKVMERNEPAKPDAEKERTSIKLPSDSPDPTAIELTIYQQYVVRRLALPSVIRANDLAKAKEQILGDLARAYGITSEQVLQVVDKVYEYRRKGTSN